MTESTNSMTSMILKAHEGGKLSRAEAKVLEEKIDLDQEDLDSRATLLGYYHRSTILTWSGFLFASLYGKSKHQEKYLNLIRWVVEMYPSSFVAGLPEMYPPFGFDSGSQHLLKSMWLKNVEECPSDTNVLRNASSFFHHTDQQVCEALLRKANELEPENPYWNGRLAQLDSIRASRDPDLLHSALCQKEEEVEKSPRINPYDLGDLAELSFAVGDFEKAASTALKLLKLASERADRRNDYGNAVHDGNCVLGRIAFAKGDVSAAKEFLLNASRSLGSPSLNSYGPGMDLAQELLSCGERKVVLQYLWGCHRFWNGLLSTPLVLFWSMAIILRFKPKLNSVGRLPKARSWVVD